jgi:hypothetical protein
MFGILNLIWNIIASGRALQKRFSLLILVVIMFLRVVKLLWFIAKILLFVGIIYGLFYLLNSRFGIANPLKEVMSKFSDLFKWMFSFGKGSIIPQ